MVTAERLLFQALRAPLKDRDAAGLPIHLEAQVLSADTLHFLVSTPTSRVLGMSWL